MRIKLIRQVNTFDCAACCISMILRYYGSRLSVASCRKLAGTGKNGTTVYGIVQALEAQNMQIKTVFSSEKNKMFSSQITLPAILNVINSKKESHFIVLYKIKNNKFYVADPDLGYTTYTLNEIRSICTGLCILSKPSEKFIIQTEKTENSNIKYLKILYSEKKRILILFLISLITTLTSCLFVYYIQLVIDKFVPIGVNHTFYKISILLVLSLLVQGMCAFIRDKLLSKVSCKISNDLMKKFFSHIMNLQLEFFRNMDSGEIISRFRDISYIQNSISQVVLSALIDALMVIASAIFMIIIFPSIFLIAIISILIYIPVALFFQRLYAKKSKNVLINDAILSAELFQSIDNVETIKSLSIESKVTQKSYKAIDKTIDSLYNLNITKSVHTSIHSILHGICLLISVYLGALSIMSGSLSYGTFFICYLLISYFIDPLERLINLFPSYQSAINSIDRLSDILEVPVEVSQGSLECKSSDKLELVNIDFEYVKGIKIIDNVNMKIPKGKRSFIIGDSGSGKTTLALIISNLYFPNKGFCCIDGKKYTDYSLNSIREKILYVSQNTSLLSDTIINNLLIASSHYNEDDVIRVCKLTKIYDYIMSLPRQFQTVLSENGANLSQGQRQRLCIARALLSNPEILILDEATNCLDFSTEQEVFKNLKEHYPEITVIVITHKIDIISDEDNVFYLEHGCLIENGIQIELLKSNNKYSIYYTNYLNNERT